MSRENVEMVRGLWEPFKGVDCTAIDWDNEAIREMTERFWSPEIELRWSRSGPEARVYQGRDGVIQAFREWVEPFSEYYVEPLDFIEREDRVIIRQRQWGIGGASGIPVEIEVTYVYEVRDSQIVRVDEYDTLEEALEAAGLSERATSQENVEIVREYFETVNDGDFARAMRYYADDVELVVPAEAFLEAGTLTGKDAVALWFGNWFRAFQRGYQFDLDEIREVGDAVFVSARHHGRGKTSGTEVRSTIAYLFHVGDGQIGKVELFPDRRSALEAVGLSAQDAPADS